VEEVRVEYQQPSQLELEDSDVEEVILESAKDSKDTNFVDSSVTNIEDVESPGVHIGPHSKHFFTLCFDDDMKIELSEPIEESTKEEQGPYILELSMRERQDYVPHLKTKKYRIVQWLFGTTRFIPLPLVNKCKLEAKLGVQFISSRWRQTVVHVVPRR